MTIERLLFRHMVTVPRRRIQQPLCQLFLTVTLIGCGHAGLNLLEAETIAVNGVAIGVSRQDVVARLGEPRSRETGDDDLMGMGPWENLTWPGLEVHRRTSAGDDPFWYYLTVPFDGSVVVTFRDRRVVEIRIAEDWT